MAIASLFVELHSRVINHTLESTLLLILAIPVIYVAVNECVRANARISGLKGPRGLPLLGNIWDIRTNAAEKYRQWSKQYGGIYQIQLGNIPIVVVNTAATAKVIFGQNSQALASRPEFYTFRKSPAAIGHEYSSRPSS